MIWFLALHIIFLLIWCGALLSLPLLLVARSASEPDLPRRPEGDDPLPRLLFTSFATPAALLAITFGTAVFLWTGTLGFWMWLKLILVVALVCCHALLGWLILGVERGTLRRVRLWSNVLQALAGLLMLAIVAVVLGKPAPEVGPWTF